MRHMKLNWGFWIGIVCFILVLLIPTFSEFTVIKKNMLAITVLMAIWWMSEALPLGITALLPLGLYPLLRIMKTSEVSTNYTHHLIFLFLGGFLIASAIQKWGLHRRFALFTIAFLGTNPRKVILGFMLSTALLSMWISNTATALMMLPIALAVIHQLPSENSTHQPPQNTFAIVLLLGIAYSASIGGMATLIGTPPNIIFSGIFTQYFPHLPEFYFLKWMIYILPLSTIIFLVIYFYLAFFYFKKKYFQSFPGIDDLQNEYDALGPITIPQRRVMVVFILTAILWIFRTRINLGLFSIPSWTSIFGLEDIIQDSTIAIGMAIFLFIISAGKSQSEEKLLELKNLLEIPWDILLLFGGGFALAAGIQKSGLAFYLGEQLLFLGNLPLGIMLYLVSLSVALFTEITSNTAVATTLLPIFASLSKSLQINPLILMLPITIASSCAFMLPVATPPNAIVFGSRLIPIKKMTRIGFVLNILVALIISVYFYTIFQIIGIY